jgi:predicted nucleotidyltransferase
MNNRAVRDELAIVTSTAEQIFPESKTILFGSRATGNEKEDSDIDICVIINDRSIRRIDACHVLRKAIIGKINIPIDILVFYSDDFEVNSKRPPMIEYRIAREGVTLNA